MYALIGVNLISFLLMGIDKRRAIKNRWRIPEKTLLGVSALFGALGGTLGMYAFRHKTLHPRFRFGLPAMLVIQIAILAFLLIRF